MFRKYSPPATEPRPSVSFSIAPSRASSRPSFTLAVTRYRTRKLYYAKGPDLSVGPARFPMMGTSARLVVIAAAEAGAGRSLCTASIAMSLARRWRCLAVDLDVQSGDLQKFLGTS